MPPWTPSTLAVNSPLLLELDASYAGVHVYSVRDNNSSASPGDRSTNRSPHVSSLEDLKGKLLSEAMDPYGCQFLHQKLQERKPEDIRMIYICILMLDKLGSYLLQKLYEVCDEEQMTQLVSSVTVFVRLLMDICMDSQGYVQNLITSLKFNEFTRFSCFFADLSRCRNF